MFDGVQTCDAPPGRVDNAEDCYDGNSDARPDQTELFAIHRGDGSFDYDCDGHYRYESLEVGQCKTLPECPLMPGWDRGAPPCGEGGRLLTQCRPPSAGGMRRCEAEFQDAVQRCR